MTIITVPAVYRDGALYPAQKLDLPEGAAVEVQVSALAGAHTKPASAQSLLRHADKFQFYPGEMDGLLTHIARMRELDLDPRG